MPDHSTYFEATGGGLVLSNAILLYRIEATRGARSSGSAAFASMHAIEHAGEGPPTIATGTPLTRAHLREWTEALGRTVPPKLLPANVLVAHPDMLAWWAPEQVRTAYFDLSRPSAGLQALSRRTNVVVPYPPHLFVATRSGLGVYALPANERPTADTPVLHSPVLNVFLDGQLCWGNIPRPQELTIASMAAFESAVFDSWSTHSNIGQEQTVTGKGGLVRLWDDLAARKAKRFPVRRLRHFDPAARGQGSRRTKAAEHITVAQIVAWRAGR